MNDNYKYGFGGKNYSTPNRPCSPCDEIIQNSKDFLVEKIKEAYFGNDCMSDVLISTSSYCCLDEYEMDEENINECLRIAFKEIEEMK